MEKIKEFIKILSSVLKKKQMHKGIISYAASGNLQ